MTLSRKYKMCEKAAKEAQRLIIAAGFPDLLNYPFDGIHVVTYTNKELVESKDERNWVGQYITGSIDEAGVSVLINISKHSSYGDMCDTILHEVGHALWELVDQGRQEYMEQAKDERWGPEEAFADAFMYLCKGEKYMMVGGECFMRITRP